MRLHITHDSGRCKRSATIRLGAEPVSIHMMPVWPNSRPPARAPTSRAAEDIRTTSATDGIGAAHDCSAEIAAADRDQETCRLAFMAGLVAAAVGAGLWAFVTLATTYQIAWVAVGVGWAIRVGGKGKHTVFRIVGVVLAVGGCAVGNLLAVIIIAARQFGVPFQDFFTRLTPAVVYSPMQSSFRSMHVFF